MSAHESCRFAAFWEDDGSGLIVARCDVADVTNHFENAHIGTVRIERAHAIHRSMTGGCAPGWMTFAYPSWVWAARDVIGCWTPGESNVALEALRDVLVSVANCECNPGVLVQDLGLDSRRRMTVEVLHHCNKPIGHVMYPIGGVMGPVS